jgi:hypothetical protein
MRRHEACRIGSQSPLALEFARLPNVLCLSGDDREGERRPIQA